MTDPNWLPQEVEEIKRYVNEIRNDKQLYIIYTHSDFDHIIGSGAFPDAIVVASRKLSENKHKDDLVKKINMFDQSYYLQRNYRPEYPQVDEVISRDGQELILGTTVLTFYTAPGHTDDGLFTVIEPAGIFLTGDYLSDVEFPFIFSGYLDYLETKEKASGIFSKHNISIQVPGHGHTTEDKIEMKKRLEFSQKYLKRLVSSEKNMEKILSGNYTFFVGMKSIHIDNKKLAQKETE